LRRLFAASPAASIALFGPESAPVARVATICALGLAAQGRTVTIIDELCGDGSVARLFRCAGRRDLAQVLSGDATLAQALLAPQEAIRILPAGRAARRSRGDDLATGKATAKLLARLGAECDLLLHAATVGERGLSVATEGVARRVVCVPIDAHGITLAYRQLKLLAACGGRSEIGVVMTGGSAGERVRAAYENLHALAGDRLDLRLRWLGWAPARELREALHGIPGRAPGASWTRLAGALAEAAAPGERWEANGSPRRPAAPRRGAVGRARMTTAITGAEA
jgi:MinD-like ATPase involved in chromosome partitioning or flagellar assembly